MRCGTILLIALVGMPAGAMVHARGADGPPPGGATRVVEGRCLDEAGQPPRDARIGFSPSSPTTSPSGTWSTRVAADGRYRVELASYTDPNSGEVVAPNGALRFHVLATGFRVDSGQAEGGSGPLRVDVRLVAEAWPETEIELRDAAGRPVPGAEVALTLDASGEWSRTRGDAAGRCRVAHPRNAGFEISAHHEAGLTTTFGMRAAADDPSRLVIPLREPIRGRVVDTAGRPCPGIAVGGRLGRDEQAQDPAARRRVVVEPSLGDRAITTTDADGRFTLQVNLRLDPRGALDRRTGEFRAGRQALCVADADARRVAFVSVDWNHPLPSYDITLQPARQVFIPVEHEISIPAGDLETQWSLTCLTDAFGADTSIFTMYGAATENPRTGTAADTALIEAFWPVGRYELRVETVNERLLERVEGVEVVVPPGEGPVRLPLIPLAVPAYKRLVGQPAPELDARDLDTGAPVRLADLRGKVVLLDFWGYWCGPCLGSMPGLVQLHEQFRDQPVAIVALHDESVQSRAAYDTKLDGVKRAVWNNRDLPFRVALDRPDPARAPTDPPIGHGVTCDRYKIRGFPTTYLIDQDGKVVATVNARLPDQVAGQIKALLARPPGR